MAGVNCCSVRLTQHKTITQNSKANIMATKKNVKVRDLKPTKDAKGGGKGLIAQGSHASKGGAAQGTKASGHHGPSHNQ